MKPDSESESAAQIVVLDKLNCTAALALAALDSQEKYSRLSHPSAFPTSGEFIAFPNSNLHCSESSESHACCYMQNSRYDTGRASIACLLLYKDYVWVSLGNAMNAT